MAPVGHLMTIRMLNEGQRNLGLDSQRPPVARAQAPPELFDPGPDYDVADPSFTD